MDVDMPSPLSGTKRKQEDMEPPFNEMATASTSNLGEETSVMNWKKMQSTIIDSIKAENAQGALDVIIELRNNLELVHSTEYPTMLATMLPLFRSILQSVPCTPSGHAYLSIVGDFHHDSVGLESPTKAKTDKIEHTIRHTIIELCTRLPQNEVLRPYVGPLLNLCMQILHDDYEENALLATRLLLDLHKNYRPSTVDYVQPFLDFVLLLYRQLPGNAQRNFILINEVPDAHPMIPRFTSEALSQDPSLLSLKSTHSFRVLMECPLTVMLLFNLYPKFIKKNLSQLLPVMMESLTHRPPKHAHSSNISSVNDKENENGPVIDIKSLYYKRAREFLSAQVKTLSFVTHLLRGYSEQLKPFENILTNSVLNMFQMCPREAITTRRDLLFSLRHIFATSFRRGFIDHIDTLLDERILVGKLRLSEHTGLKAIAYSTLGDLLLHARSKLTMSQVSRIVHIYSRVLHDASMNLPLTVQTSSVRLLITLIDPVYHNKEVKASSGRNIMHRILETLISKIGMLLEHGISDVKKHEEALSKGLLSYTREFVEGSSNLVSNNGQLNTSDDFLYGPEHPPIGTTLNLFELVKPLMNGIKTLIWCISNYGNQREKNVKEKDSKGKSKGASSEQSTTQTPQWYEDASVQSINTQERELIGKYFDWTLEVLKVFKGEDSTDESRDQYQQLLENFASSLTVLDSFNFQRIVGPKMRKLINSIHEDSSVIVIVEHLLVNSSNVSADFAACLLNELMSRSQQIDLGIDKNSPLASLNMSLFSLVFKSVSVHPKNERVLRPYIQTIISICFRRAVDCDTINWPDNHLTLIRKLFRTITNGKNEDSYKEIVPLLATLLNGLYRLFCRSQDTLLSKIVIELCITVPARLSSLLPHLSLLLRVIIPALRSGEGELINAGLRTLEFWVEHLNPDFLFPILTQDEDLLVELMSSLALHLQPAPYQYGLLTVRLLGKLGGMNKAFLNVPMNVSSVSKEVMSPLSMNFEWDRPPDSSQNHHDFSVNIPIRRSTIVLECVASMSRFRKNNEQSLGFNEDNETVMQTIQAIVQEEKDFEKIDLSSLKSLFIYERTREQAEAAMVMLRSAVELMLDIPNDPSFQFDVLLESEDSWQEDLKNSKVSFSDSNIPENSTLKCVMEGLIHATCISFLEEEAKLLLHSLVSQFVYLICSNHRDVRRVDSISNGEDGTLMEKRQREPSIKNGKLNSFVSFGRFVFGGQLNTGINFFLPTEAIAQALSSRKSHTVYAALDMITDLFNTLKCIDEKVFDKISSQMNLWMESLLFSLFQACFSCAWEQRSGLYDGLSRLLNLCDQNWCKHFELELFHLAFYCLKEVPLEAVSGQKDALVFFRRMLHLLYQEKDDQSGSNQFTHKSLFDGEKMDIKTCYADSLPLSDSICDFLFSELSNNRSIVRSAARLGIDFLYGGKSNDSSVNLNLNEIFKKQSSVIRRLLFNRSLRHLQLQDQIATIEAFNFTISHAPDVLPLSDNHTIIFLSELLKIMSVGDGEMTSESIPSSCVVDKDGLCPKVPANGCMIDKMSPLTHSTSIFLRGAFVIVQGGDTYRAKIDGDLPVGVQYRVATLQLFGKILKENTNDFLKAEPTSSLGNILPHIVSLLFRSLASRPEEAVEIAHLALHDILTRDSEVNEGEQHKHGLPRHLLQLCIRPVLLNLRDYTKLTIPLLRGLSRLMSLLSSWFSKTLGEKLLELLQRWYEPEKIINLRQWKQGEEPLVAAELISMFQMLPDESSNFVEPLIKTTLKLEAVLHHYMGFFTESPFRKPLCQYLNKHGPAVVLFFVNDRRLKNPIYSELLQDITRRKESSELRKHLSSTECSTILLNVCFERPLAIIRSEKGQSGSSRQSGASISPRGNNFDALTMHGIVMDAPSKKTALEHQIKLKEEKLKVAKKEECKAKDMIEKEVNSLSVASAPEKQHLVEALKQKHARTLVLVDSAEKELGAAREDYANELATLNTQQQADKQNDDKNILPKPMSFDTLELQLQGFVLATALMENDDTYTSEHHNLFRTFRWLWRSKGRHFRLLHEDVMPSRFVSESRYLAAFTVAYSKTAPADIEILFDLVRTFLQPTSEDFTFVRQHLHDTVCNRLPLEQKKKVLMRFLPVIVSEGLEELKIVTCQNIMIPMLKHYLKTSSVIKESTVTSEGTDNKIDTSQLNSLKNEVSSLDDNTISSLIGSEFLQKMADDILAKDTIKEFGSRVTVELLKLCCLLIDYARDQLGEKQQDLVKFAWKILKCDDPRAKHWAYIAICKIIAYFDAPENTILQVYVALLRAHSQDTKDLVRNALDVLLPVLQKKLSPDNQKQAVRSTIKILHEEANSAPHLNHIWYTVVRHEYIFYDSRRKLVPHLISSLNRFGLPSNVSTESKELAIALVELLLYWSKMQNKIIVDEVTSHDESRDFNLNQNEVNAIVNFLVRLVLLLAVADKAEQQMESKISSLFEEVIVRWEVFELRIEYFEKVLSMCENELKRDEDILLEKRLKKGDESIRNNQNASKRGKKNGETIRIPTLLLSSCLKIFIHLVRYTPSNRFLNSNTSKFSSIMRLCFKHVNEVRSPDLWAALVQFTEIVYATKGFENMKLMMRYILEEFLIAGVETDHVLAGLPSGASKTRKDKLRFDVIEKALSLIKVASKSENNLVNSFSKVLITVTEKLIKHNLQNAAKDRKAAKSSYTVALVNEALFESERTNSDNYFSSRTSGTSVYSDHKKSEKNENKAETECLYQCICLLRFDCVVFRLASDRKRYLAIIYDILESIADVRILLAVISQISRWILAKDNEMPLTRKELKSLLNSLMLIDEQCLPIIDGEFLMCALALITFQIWISYSQSGSERNILRYRDEFTTFINRGSIKFLMSSKPEIRALFCKMVSGETATMSDLERCMKSTGFQYIQDSISGRGPLDLLKHLLASDLQGLAFKLWTFIFNDVLLSRTCHDGPSEGSMCTALNINITPSKIQSSESIIHLQNEHALNLVNHPTNRARFISALRILASSDSELNQSLLEKLISAAWCSSNDEKHQISAVPFIEHILLRPYHVQFLKSETSSDNIGILHSTVNAVKSFLGAINMLDPLPYIDTDILISSAVNYSCWHEVRSILEKQHSELTKASNSDFHEHIDLLSSSIRRCYLEIGEKDTWLSLRAEECKLPGIQRAAGHDMYSNIAEALKSYVHLIDTIEYGADDNAEDGVAMELSIAFLEERWVALQRESCAWNVLEEYLGEDGPFKVMIECAWKTKNWEKLRRLCSSPSAVSALELGDMDVKMSEILLAISDGKLNEVENLHAQTAQLCLYNWQLLPSVYSGCDAHSQILHMFNRLVDIRESGQIMVEASHHTNSKSYPDFKSILNSWRNRLPGTHEQISCWDDIFVWRSHMFSAVITKFHWVEQNMLAALHDRPWTAIRFAQTAREQGADEISLMSIGLISDCAMAVGDAFSKLKEQILLYKNGGENERKAGLNLISTTNLSFFDPSQKSELFRLKGDFLDLIANSYNGKTKASQAYCHAVQLCPTYSRPWVSWGGLCWSLGEILERQHRSLSTETEEEKEKKDSMAKKFVQYYAQAMGCYLEAVKCDSSEDSRIFIPRVLLCLAKDGTNPDLLCQTFDKYALTIPAWIWLPWIPQLLSSLCRAEAKTAKSILTSILSAYPQSLYFSLRSFYLERRDIERSRMNKDSSAQSGHSSVSLAEDLMSFLRKNQPILWMSLETIIEELIIRFRPSYEEELLATITALVTRVDTQLENQHSSNDDNDTENESIRASFRKTLTRISTKFFSMPSDSASPSSEQDLRSKRTAEFTVRYKDAFIEDFGLSTLSDSDKQECKLPLDQIITKLMKWKRILETKISSTPPTFPLMQASSALSSFTNVIPDLWPGACGPEDDKRDRSDKEPESTQSPKSSFAASFELAEKAALAVRAANAYENYGDGRGGGWISVEIPGQYAPNSISWGKPSPELHVKLVKFESNVEVSRRNQQLVRRIGMMGSNGRIYHFLLQFAIPYWTRADERTAQLHQIFDRCLRKEKISAQRHLWLRPTAVLPVAQRLRMIAEERHHISLEQIFTQDCKRNGIDEQDVSDLFIEEVRKYRIEHPNEVATNKARVHALNVVCNEKVSSSILKCFIYNLYGNVEKVYQFSRAFTAQTALNSLLQYAFDINERTPSKFMFNSKNGHVLSLEFRLSYSNQGFIDEIRPVPFRLTRNIESFIGPFLMKGVFAPAMASGATAICSNEADLDQTLQLLFRDDIVSWYLSKSSGSQRPIYELERQLSDRVRKNIYLVQNRLRECSVIEFKRNETDSHIDDGVRKLIHSATSIDNIAQMPSTYAPWL